MPRPWTSPPVALSSVAWLALAAGAAAQEARGPTAIAGALIEAHVPSVDDADALARRLLETATRESASAAAALLVAEARRLVPALQQPAECARLVERYLSAGPHGLGALEARRLQVRLLARTGARREARTAAPFADHASVLLAIGPFGDGGDHYTRVPFAPELRFPAPGTRLAGRHGPVEVRVVRRRPLRRTIDLAPRGERRDGCLYGLHQVVADADVSCYLEVTCAGSFEVFVNGEPRHVTDRHDGRPPQVARFGIALREGHNHVLVKTTLNRHGEVGLRYLDAAGRPPPGLRPYDPREGPALRPCAAARAGAAEAGPFPDGLRRLAQTAHDARGEPRQQLLLAAALTAFRQRDPDAGMRLLHELDRDPPAERGRLGLAHAKLLRDATPLPAEIRQGRARRIVEANAELADHHWADLARVGLLEDQDQREDAVRLLQARVEAGTAGPETFDRLHRLLGGLGFSAEARLLRDRWRRSAPLDTRPVLAEAAERVRGGDARGALSLLSGVLASVSDDTLRRRALDLARELGEADLALRLVDEIHELEPSSLAALLDRVNTLRALGRADEAAELDRAIARHDDATARQVREAGDRLLLAAHLGEAEAAYVRSVALDPSQHDLRRLLARLAGREVYPEMARFARDGDEVIAAFAPTERERASASTLVLDQMIVRLYQDGSAVKETHQIRRINDLSGVERHQEARQAASADEVLLVRTIGKDGRSYVPNRVAGSFAMPRLEPGAFVEERHRDYQKSPAPDPWRGLEFHFQSEHEPFLLSELVVIRPEDHPGHFRTRNFGARPEVVELDDGLRAWVFRRTGVPRLPSERHVPPLEEIVPVVTYGEDGGVDAHARSLRSDALAREFVTPPVEEQTAAVIAGCRDDMEKARAIHDFVHDEIASGAGTAPTETLLRRRGARFFLEVAMLGLADVPFSHAAVAAAREELSREATPFFLGTERYDLPAVRVEPRGAAPYWLFAGAPRYLPLGFIPHQNLGAAALLLDRGSIETTRLPLGRPDQATGFAVRATVKLAEEGRAEMEAKGLLRGATGHAASEQLRMVEEDVQQVVARQIAGRMFPGWTLRSVELEGIKQKGLPLLTRAQLERRRALEPAGERLLMRLPLDRSEFFARYGDRGERTLPLRLAGMNASSWEVTIEPGERYRFLEIPPPVRVRHMLLDFSLTFERQGDDLVVRREAVQRPGTISAAQFAEWVELLRRLDLAEETSLVLGER